MEKISPGCLPQCVGQPESLQLNVMRWTALLLDGLLDVRYAALQ